MAAMPRQMWRAAAKAIMPRRRKSTFRGFTMYSDARILHEANRLRGKLLRRFILRLLRSGPRAGQLHPS